MSIEHREDPAWLENYFDTQLLDPLYETIEQAEKGSLDQAFNAFMAKVDGLDFHPEDKKELLLMAIEQIEGEIEGEDEDEE